MTAGYGFAKLSELLGGVFSVHHVAQVILTPDLVLMNACKIVLRKLEGDGKQNVERIQDLHME